MACNLRQPRCVQMSRELGSAQSGPSSVAPSRSHHQRVSGKGMQLGEVPEKTRLGTAKVKPHRRDALQRVTGPGAGATIRVNPL